MNPYREARCPNGHDFTWLTGTPFICPVCKYQMHQQGDRFNKPLTHRELEIVGLVAEGLTNRQISEHRIIQECTVENHMHSIFTKLGLKTRTQVARYAWEHGIGVKVEAEAENEGNRSGVPLLADVDLTQAILNNSLSQTRERR